MQSDVPVALGFQRYLRAKRTVDDRALNARVWHSFAAAMGARAEHAALDVLEVGSGIGTMLERLVDHGLIGVGAYTGLDGDPRNTLLAQDLLAQWAGAYGAVVQPEGSGQQRVLAPGLDLRATFVSGEAVSFARERAGLRAWDAVLAHAFLDLVELPRALPALVRLVRPGGLFYATLNFDGETIFQPEVEPSLEGPILAAYHRTMDERIVDGLASGDARTGRHLFGQLAAAGLELEEAGASDWVVFARRGIYPGDEEFFLRFIIRTIHDALAGRTDVPAESLEPWTRLRMGHIDRGELVYLAHQMDFLARAP